MFLEIFKELAKDPWFRVGSLTGSLIFEFNHNSGSKFIKGPFIPDMYPPGPSYQIFITLVHDLGNCTLKKI